MPDVPPVVTSPAPIPPKPSDSKTTAVLKAVYNVLISRPVRPYEIALALACLKAAEKAAGFSVGF